MLTVVGGVCGLSGSCLTDKNLRQRVVVDEGITSIRREVDTWLYRGCI